ncbi:hypothetical protein RYX36_014675 [Vicia faba]
MPGLATSSAFTTFAEAQTFDYRTKIPTDSTPTSPDFVSFASAGNRPMGSHRRVNADEVTFLRTPSPRITGNRHRCESHLHLHNRRRFF